MSIQKRVAELQAKDDALLESLDDDTKEALKRRIRAIAMAAGMHERLGSCKTFGEAEERARTMVYEDACAPRADPEAITA